jgi:hypothetical protein
MKKPLLVAALLVLPLSVFAKDMDGQFAVFSTSGERCADYSRARLQGAAAEKAFANWTLGYLSAFNLIVSDTFNIMGQHSFHEALNWLDKHCHENPDAYFVNAAARLTESLHPVRANMAPHKDNRGKWAGLANEQQQE